MVMELSVAAEGTCSILLTSKVFGERSDVGSMPCPRHVRAKLLLAVTLEDRHSRHAGSCTFGESRAKS